MFRSVHVLLTVASLLACPLNCLGRAADDCASERATAACSCCHAQPERAGDPCGAPANDAPPTPADDCGGDCLCRGAVLTKDDLSSDLGVTPSAPAGVMNVAPAEEARSGQFALSGSGKTASPAALFGRALRFALQSLLC